MNFKLSGVAQLVEQATVNRWVTGSSPVAGAILDVVQDLGTNQTVL